MKIGVVHIGRLLNDSKRGKSSSARLREIGERWERELAALETKLDDLRAHLARPDAAAPADLVFKLRRDSRLAELELSSVRDRMQFEIDFSRDHFRAQVLADLAPMIEALATERGLSLVLTEEQGVVHADAQLDLTDELCRRLDTYGK